MPAIDYLYDGELRLLRECEAIAVRVCVRWKVVYVPHITFDADVFGHDTGEPFNSSFYGRYVPSVIWLNLESLYSHGKDFLIGTLYHELAHHLERHLYKTQGHGEPFFTICKKLHGYIGNCPASAYETNPYTTQGLGFK